MQTAKRISLLLLLPGLIWVVSSACSLGGSESSSEETAIEQETATEQEAAAEASTQTDETADTTEPAAKEQAAESQESIEAREATTVVAAAQLLDLSSLFLPTEIKSMGQNEVGYLSFELPTDDVASVVDMYQPYFIEQGWQNDAENEYTEETTANRYFSKDGFVVSMSASNLGESVMVTFINHGNIDLRALPQTTDAEPLYQFPHTLGYVSPAEVSDVVDFTRRELAAQGWHEYTPPNTATADNADSQSLTFVQNGLDLSAFISTAPAQGNKTSVQYNILLLSLDLPIYDEAIGLEYDKYRPYLSYKTAAGIETLVDFYFEELIDLGWTEMSEITTVTPEQTVLFFAGQQLHANESNPLILMLELALVDGQTKTTLHQIDEEDIFASQQAQTEGDSLTEDTTAAEAGMSAFLIPAEAQDVEHIPNVAVINYVTSLDMETVLDFYRQALTNTGWDEANSFVTDDYSDIEFVQGDELVYVMLDKRSDDTILTMVDLSSAPSISGDGGTTPDDEQIMTDSSTAEMPALPIADDAQSVVYNADFAEIRYTSPSDVETLVEYYRQALPADNWQEDEDFSYVDETFASLDFVQGESSLTVELFGDGSGEATEVSLYGYGPVWDADITTTATGSTSLDDLTLVEENGFLIPSDNTGLFTESSQFSEIATVYTPSDFETLAALYERELPNHGGNLLGYTIQISENRFDITEPEGDLFVTFQVVGGETEMTMTRRNVEAAEEAGILPASGQGRIYLGNILETGNIVVKIEGQEITVPPSDPQAESPDGFEYVELAPGTYTVTTILPDGSEVGDDVELKPDSVVMLLLDADGPWPLSIY